MSTAPRATIIIPTHEHAYTIDLVIESALAQTVEDIEILILGDGCDDATRTVVERYWRTDDRVRFMDLPKGPHRGEAYRNDAVRAARAPVVGYLADDDLLFPDHVDDMLKLLEDADLAHSLNGFFRPDGSFEPYAADLADPMSRAWHLRPGCNGVSITGTFHTVDAFERLPRGWRVPEPGEWADHTLWQQFLGDLSIRAITSDRLTTVQLPSHAVERSGWSPMERRSEIEQWMTRIALPGERARIDAEVARGSAHRVAVLQAHLTRTEDDLTRERDALSAHVDELQDELTRSEEHVRRLSRSWPRRLAGRIRRSLARREV